MNYYVIRFKNFCTSIPYILQLFHLIFEREFSIFKNEMDGRKQKRIQSSDADDFRIAFFTRADGWVNLLNAEN